MPHLSYCMERNTLGMMEETHVKDEHEKTLYLQVLLKGDSHSFSKTTNYPMCADDCTHHALKGPHSHGKYQDYSVIQVHVRKDDI